MRCSRGRGGEKKSVPPDPVRRRSCCKPFRRCSRRRLRLSTLGSGWAGGALNPGPSPTEKSLRGPSWRKWGSFGLDCRNRGPFKGSPASSWALAGKAARTQGRTNIRGRSRERGAFISQEHFVDEIFQDLLHRLLVHFIEIEEVFPPFSRADLFKNVHAVAAQILLENKTAAIVQ